MEKFKTVFSGQPTRGRSNSEVSIPNIQEKWKCQRDDYVKPADDAEQGRKRDEKVRMGFQKMEVVVRAVQLIFSSTLSCW